MNNIESCFVGLGSYISKAGIIAPCTGFLEINAPRLLWVGCVLLIGFNLFVTLVMGKTYWSIRRELTQLTNRVEKLKKGKDEALNLSGLQELRSIMQGSSLTKDAWSEFEETLFRWGEGADARFFNTCQADTYFSHIAILTGRMNVRF